MFIQKATQTQQKRYIITRYSLEQHIENVITWKMKQKRTKTKTVFTKMSGFFLFV